MRGVCPRLAQVRLVGGVIEKPASSSKHSQASFEKRMGEVRTWRTDSTARSAVYELREIREDARTWLSFLAEIGYPLSSVEQAIVDDEPYQEGEPDAADTDGQADEDTPDDPDGVSAEDSEDAS
jgi:ParB family chromosome partitioning protein